MGQDTTSKDASSAGFHAGAFEDAERSFADGARQCGPVAGALWRCHRKAADRRAAAAGEGDCALRPAGSLTPARRARSSTRVESSPRLNPTGSTTEVRSPITGRLRELSVQAWDKPSQPATKSQRSIREPNRSGKRCARCTWSVSRTTFPRSAPIERDLPEIPDHVRKQAVETEQAIRQRSLGM